jgi:hypothetical protein
MRVIKWVISHGNRLRLTKLGWNRGLRAGQLSGWDEEQG